jgi:predicted nucleic acid-binding protein
VNVSALLHFSIVCASSSLDPRLHAAPAQAEWAKRGRTIHTPNALIGATARAYGAVLLTPNVADFPMHDLRVEAPGARSGD